MTECLFAAPQVETRICRRVFENVLLMMTHKWGNAGFVSRDA